MKSTSAIFDDKLDEELRSKADIDEKWEEYLSAGPTAVNYIGNLMIIASKKDFALVRPTPEYVYTSIKYPSSFRATLVHAANEMYAVFYGAHNSMDRIQGYMQLIPGHIKTALKLLTSASPRLIQTLLPQTLANIKRVVSQCVQSASSTEQSFKSLSALLAEIRVVTQGTESSTSNALVTVNSLLANSTKEQELLNTQIDEMRKKFEFAREALQKAQQEYHAAFHAIPGRRKKPFGGFIGNIVSGVVGGVSGLVSGVVGGISNVVGGVFNTVGCIFSSCSSKPNGQPNGQLIDNSVFTNAKEKAELALKRLKEAEEAYDKWYAQLQEKQNKLTANIVQLSQLDFEKVDHQTIINILIDAMKEIVEIQVQWSKMTGYFSKLVMRAEGTQDTILYEFIQVIEDTQAVSAVLDDADREFYVTLLLPAADDIDRGAHLLYLMAQTYYDVSQKYMMTQIAGISGLILTQTDAERTSRMKQIAQETTSTSAKVSRMALERRQEYDQRNKERQAHYKNFLQQMELEGLQSAIGK